MIVLPCCLPFKQCGSLQAFNGDGKKKQGWKSGLLIEHFIEITCILLSCCFRKRSFSLSPVCCHYIASAKSLFFLFNVPLSCTFSSFLGDRGFIGHLDSETSGHWISAEENQREEAISGTGCLQRDLNQWWYFGCLPFGKLTQKLKGKNNTSQELSVSRTPRVYKKVGLLLLIWVSNWIHLYIRITARISPYFSSCHAFGDLIYLGVLSTVPN